MAEGSSLAKPSLCQLLASVLGTAASSARTIQASLEAMLRADHAEAMHRFAVVARRFFAGPRAPRPRPHVSAPPTRAAGAAPPRAALSDALHTPAA